MAEHEVLGGRYELGEPLGRGGMAEVRAAVDLRLQRPVAVKLLSAALAADPLFRTRFRREAQSSARLNHPGIVAVFDTGEETDPETGVARPYIVMERVEGQTLRAVLTGGHQLPPQRALEITSAVLDALSHSHAAGVVHRDIKPANVMLTPTGAVKVMDFGIARAVTDTSTDLTQTAAVIGTAQYLSPEQARGEAVDQRSDIYSTGCLLYELLVGRPPFRGETAISVVYQHVREPPDPPSTHSSLIHPQIDAITLKALAKDPADRYQSAREMGDDLGRVLAGEPAAAASVATAAAAPDDPPATAVLPAVAVRPVAPEAPRVTVPEGPPARRRAGVVGLVTALVVLLLVGGGYGIYRALAPGGGAAMVSVPRVVGDSRAAAENTLRNASLTPRVNEVDGKDDDTLDTVVSQNPTDGRVAADSVVTLEVNVGKKTGTIPTGLLGRDVDDVKKILEDAGFRVRTDKVDDPPAGTGKDDVTAVDPSEGTSVALRTRITVSYAGRSATSGSDSSTRKASAGTSAEPTRSTSSADPTAEESSTSPTARPTDDDSSEPSDPTSTGKPTSGKPTSSKPSSGKPTSGKPTKSKPTKSKPTRSKKENPPQPGPGNG